MRSTAQALLVHDNRHAQVLDGVGLRMGISWQEVLHERTEGFIELASGFSGDGAEHYGRFARTRYDCEDGDLPLGDAQRDILQVVFTSAAYLNIFLEHRFLLLPFPPDSNANPNARRCRGLSFIDPMVNGEWLVHNG